MKKKTSNLKYLSHSVIFKSIIMAYREPCIYYSFWFLLEWSARALTSRDISIYPIIRSVAVLTSPPVPQPRHLGDDEALFAYSKCRVCANR